MEGYGKAEASKRRASLHEMGAEMARDTPSISQCLRAPNGTDMRLAVEYAHGREEGGLGNRTVNREPLPGVLDTATAP